MITDIHNKKHIIRALLGILLRCYNVYVIRLYKSLKGIPYKQATIWDWYIPYKVYCYNVYIISYNVYLLSL